MRSLRVSWCAALILFVLCGPVRAQYIDSFFPPVVPGFDDAQGVTVLTRLRPGYEQPGVRLGSFMVQPSLTERVGYDSNINGVSRATSSGFVQTSPSVSATSDWSRNRVGLSASADNYTYFDAPQNNYTNYSASIGYSHLRLHELGTNIAAVATSTPLPFDVDAIRADYTFESGRFAFVPSVDLRLYQFGTATINGIETSQRYRDRVVATAGVTTRYSITDQRSLLLVVQGSNSHFVTPTSGLPNADSHTVQVLTGIDFQATGPLRYRLLVGGQVRDFKAAQYGTRTGPVIEAAVIWTPTGLTTVTGTARRAIEDPQTEQTSGYTLTTLRAVVDHELRRDVLLQGRAAFQSAEYLQGGGNTQAYSGGAGVTWLLNRRLRLTADYDFTQQNGSGTVQTFSPLTLNTLTSGSYTRHVGVLGVRIGL